MERNIAPDQRTNPGLNGRFMKPRSPINPVTITKCQGRITEPRRTSYQVLGLRSPVKKTEPGSGMEFDVHADLMFKAVVSNSNMKITVDLPDSLFRRMEADAVLRGVSIKEFIIAAIESQITAPESGDDYSVNLPLIRSKKPGTLNLTNAEIEKLLTTGC